MKNYLRVIIIVCITFIIGMIGYATIVEKHFRNFTGNDVDVLQLNDIRETAEKNWDTLQNLDRKDFGADFVVLDNKNNMLYSSSFMEEEANLTVEQAIKCRYPYAYVV